MFVLRSTYLAKVRECEDLQSENASLNRRINELYDERTDLKSNSSNIFSGMADEIRSMDQLIYQMSQCTDWSSMRPIFNKLQTKVEARMRLESDRIRNLLLPELKKVYTKEDRP